MSKSTLYITGIDPSTKARELAEVFERHGKLLRCDIPLPKAGGQPYAFVEFQDHRDAEYTLKQGVQFGGKTLNLEWARRGPPQAARIPQRSPPRQRSPSPPRRYSRSPPRRNYRSPSPRPRRDYRDDYDRRREYDRDRRDDYDRDRRHRDDDGDRKRDYDRRYDYERRR
ncbi:RNA-binding domain-containing protein [Gonapodya prolifera JEL478]|uniref:RNA-binding domain-containing protein n=1 Tax=Gonapodya prolifera (strain JEL478) TaxID=1344416 RepID=A0A139AQ45_GONPJ|nr:RNA-binding domain-containing protein [Gonapodya prolifera JEL478]|eukprot:KXS18848.1 RNA-binding domain-containing protein [Gonapodya prolifera JEL478]